tara:strand:- start:2587 stop:2979 length:393 start_codon:yes stop_codon:yes gene_type:complete
MPKGSIDHCSDCEVRLKNTKHERTKATLCHDCRGGYIGTNSKAKELTTNLSLRNSKMTNEDLEISSDAFQDDPKAINEVLKGRIFTAETSMARGVSSLADVMSPSTYSFRSNKANENYEKKKKEKGLTLL